jgi:putative restriction endonuclease
MKIWVGVTDNDWYHHLAELQPDEVNYWRPGGGSFGAIDKYDPFLFKLHSPFDFIVGGGFYIRSTQLPLSLAWDVFKAKNGTETYEEFYQKIKGYRDQQGTMRPNPVIGCIVLTQPFFFPKEKWIPIPEDWSPNIVQGKTYHTEEPAGSRLWEEVQLRLQDIPIEERKATVSETNRYGEEYTVKPRLGQGGFRVEVIEAYHRKCAMTGEKALPVLQASHIKPYAKSGPHDIKNGLLLRADLHILFDQGYLTVTKDHHIEASKEMKEDFDNGEDYLKLHGQNLITLPDNTFDRPSPEFLEWHNENIYLS